ncbi:hypothetical protein L1987_13154 [Smallanthus sonchifolius]|uniref:Uncharacterized protein n=1 Tax=Smallanthus sonchifolius TaxID=185202 RepID=A0ACB9JJ97_9ASTR|nr:hypothetical protein L1987_13154 [Smallanthus sonchifolius]
MHSEGQHTGITPVECPFRSVIIIGSCNGILCVYEYERDAIHLWNPSIRRKATVNELPSSGFCCWAEGFGFDTVINDYKILMTFETVGDLNCQAVKDITHEEFHDFLLLNHTAEFTFFTCFLSLEHLRDKLLNAWDELSVQSGLWIDDIC